jgi:hypothetical protein
MRSLRVTKLAAAASKTSYTHHMERSCQSHKKQKSKKGLANLRVASLAKKRKTKAEFNLANGGICGRLINYY